MKEKMKLLQANFLKIVCNIQRRIQHPVKHLWWSFSQKQSRAKNRKLFPKRLHDRRSQGPKYASNISKAYKDSICNSPITDNLKPIKIKCIRGTFQITFITHQLKIMRNQLFRKLKIQQQPSSSVLLSSCYVNFKKFSGK